MKILLALVFALFAAPALAAPLTGDGGVSPFYAWTGAMPGRPGRLLRTQPLIGEGALASAGRQASILYSSTEGVGGKGRVAVSGRIFLPKGQAPKGGWPLVAFAHWSFGVADVCAPSWIGRKPLEAGFIEHWLAQGYAVVATDYQGLGAPGPHPYMASRPAAYSVLDSIRAVQAGGFGLSKKVVLIGQSQGAAAAIAAAGYAPAYAPELDIEGTVATGVPYFSAAALTAVQAVRPRDTPDPLVAYNVLLLFLAQAAEPSFDAGPYLTDLGRQAVGVAETGCLIDVGRWMTSRGVTYNQAFAKDLGPVLAKLFPLMDYPTLALKRPLFVGTGGKDRDAPTAAQQAFVKDACKAGSTVEAHLYPELDHGGGIMGSLPDSTPFVRKLFDGQPIGGGCG